MKNIPVPKGFLFSTAEAAVKKPGRKDIAIIMSSVDASAAGAFTTSTVKAAPVKSCIKKIKTGRARAIVVNSGNANACTGKQGDADTRAVCSNISRHLGLSADLVYPCSTGVIGTPMPMGRILPVLEPLAKELGKSTIEDVAKAIMTTDTFPKIVSKRIKAGGKTGVISGVCKGAGMIAPNMATMLSFIITDIAVNPSALGAILSESVKKTFNRITIDGDMSTNDTVLVMANGLAGNAPITKKSEDFEVFRTGLTTVMYDLSRLIVEDGEGATKLIEVAVKGARTEKDAEKAAFSIANSSLVKTAVYGNDANWGRIMAALGYSGVKFREEKTDIFFGRVKVVSGGIATGRDAEATAVLKEKEVRIAVNLNAGHSSATVLTCDFTEDYVRINAEYRT